MDVDLIVDGATVWSHIGTIHGPEEHNLFVVGNNRGEARFGWDLRHKQLASSRHHVTDFRIPCAASENEEVLPGPLCEKIGVRSRELGCHIDSFAENSACLGLQCANKWPCLGRAKKQDAWGVCVRAFGMLRLRSGPFPFLHLVAIPERLLTQSSHPNGWRLQRGGPRNRCLGFFQHAMGCGATVAQVMLEYL